MFLFFFSLSIIAPFIDVPSMVKSGKITYHSLFFLAEKENKGVIKVHGGTLFDYYFVFQKNMKGQERTKLVIYEYLKGLKNLIESQNQDIIIEGTSYIINERTAKKLGLKKVQTNSSQLIILIFNYFNLAMSISLVKRKLHLPNLSNLNTYQGEVSAIKSKEVFIDKMISRLDANN
ncbi:hypothetical protein [Flammeovirga pacifica]|nr:hypothetical protein [Flammeovirga pacifica]